MCNKNDLYDYDCLIIVTPKDYKRLENNYDRYVSWLPSRNIYFVGNEEVGEYVKQSGLPDKVRFINENDIIKYDDVYSYMQELLSPVLNGESLPRGVCGWYYQQFLKLAYSKICKDKYYLVWDGDTIPCKKFSMFDDDGRPYLDYKHEYHEPYFITLERILPGMSKVIEQSFIAEHMLFDCELVGHMLMDIENNTDYDGDIFWKKILESIDIDKLDSNSFSEFETFGTYIVRKYPGAYSLRCWNSMRYGGEYFDPDKICDRDFEWLSKDFFAISFEKGHSVREDHRNLFDNVKYQSKLSARQMLELAQMDFEEGYIEVWED